MPIAIPMMNAGVGRLYAYQCFIGGGRCMPRDAAIFHAEGAMPTD